MWLNKSNKGFTIIEVMIVLAIAGLIILIVLLAVPALQRNGRNTAIKNDASAIAAGLSTFASDNDGKTITLPADIAQSGSTVTIGASGTSQSEAKIQGGTSVPTPVAATPTAAILPGTIVIVLKRDCQDRPATRATAIWYSIETAKAVPTVAPFNNKCIES